MKSSSKRGGVRQLLLVLALFYLAVTLVPAAVYGALRPSPSPREEGEAPPSSPSGFLEDARLPGKPSPIPAPKQDSFHIFDTATGQVLTVPVEDYLPAALACEMDLSAPQEALKAQAVAIYTLACWKRIHEEPINGGELACDSANWQGYVSEEEMKKRWGQDFPQYDTLLRKVTNSVLGELLTWENAPICAAFFAISPGNTESSKNVWGGDYPYLKSVSSPGDCFCDGYLTQTAISPEEVKTALSALPKLTPDFSGQPDTWLQSIERSPAGFVTSLTAGGISLSGADFRTALSLRSAAFSAEYRDGSFLFTCRGWGHGVGMSQAGASAMAKGGAGYREILAHYYPDTVLQTAM